MMKYVFLLCLLVLGGAVGAMGMGVVVRWTNNMTQTQRVMPGERAFTMPPGSVPRTGGELFFDKSAREEAAKRRNPIAASPESVRLGGALYAVYCTPCHGDSGKGDGLVSSKFVLPPDLANPDLQKQRTDGYWQHVVGLGGAVMPGYSEAMTAEERWHVVNYLRSLAKK